MGQLVFPLETPQVQYPDIIYGGNASTVVAEFPHLEWSGGNAKGTSNPPLHGGNAWGQ